MSEVEALVKVLPVVNVEAKAYVEGEKEMTI
jgi:hypothetical protein